MKKIISVLLLLAAFMSASAIPVKPGMWQTITLQDGTKVRVERIGDEYFHALRSADGSLYTLKDGVYQALSSDEAQAGASKARVRRALRRKALYTSTDDGLGKYGKSGLGALNSVQGEVTIPVIMVQFKDTKFKASTTREKMTRYYNQEGYAEEAECVGSARDYFKAQSGGLFVPTFDVCAIVTLPQNYAYYGRDYGGEGNDMNMMPFVTTAITLAKEQGVDFSKYKNADGKIENVSFLYAGEGQATTDNSNLIWPHEAEFEEYNTDTEKYGNIEGFDFVSYFVGNEIDSDGSSLMGMGVFCHELGHALGLPDFYGSTAGNDAFGNWSIMDSGAYIRDTRAPICYTAYEKSVLGWLDVAEIKDTTNVELTTEKPAVVYRDPKSNNEYWIFELRQNGTWQPESYSAVNANYKFGEGLMVTHVAYSQNKWANNTPNSGSNQRCHMVKADGRKLNYSSYATNLYGGSKTSITSLPIFSSGSQAVDIKDIKLENDKVTFSFNPVPKTSTPDTSEDPDEPTQPNNPSGPTGDYFFYESFNQCAGAGGNDGKFDGQGVGNATFSPDNSGWVIDENKGYGANQCAKFGTGKVSGKATTPSFELTAPTTLTFSAAAWGVHDATRLDVTATGATLSNTVFTLSQDRWGTYQTTITPAAGSTTATITFRAGKRFFLDEVFVAKPAETTGIEVIKSENTRQQKGIYSISGMYMGTDWNALPRGIYIRDGKKIVK
jgi:immune inhibitor A